MKFHRTLVVAGLLLGASTLQAHRVWILPSMTVFSGTDQWASFEAAVSNNLFFPNHRPVPIAAIEVRGPDGQPVAVQNAVGGEVRSSFELQLKQQGTYAISLKPGIVRRPTSPGDPTLFGSYEKAGKVERWRGTPESLVAEGMAGKPGFKLRESGGRQVVTFVTCGKPSDGVLRTTGNGIEVEYLTHPNDLFVGEAARFRLLLDGKPAPGAEVTVVRGDDRYRDEAGDITLRTDADGVVEIKWPQAGRYWFEASAGTEGTLHGVPSEKSFTYIATFEVLPD